MDILSNATAPVAYADDRKIGPIAIVTITVFVFIAVVILVGSIYLLVKGKNISELFEDPNADNDGDCLSLGFSDNSHHSQGSTEDQV
jgi:hypothetical protein